MRVIHYPSRDVCCVCVAFGVGMDTSESPADAQLAHYAEHIVAAFDDAEVARLDAAAVYHNAATDGALTYFFAAGSPRGVAEVWIPILLEFIRKPRVTSDRLVKEALAAKTELHNIAQQPGTRLRELVSRVETPYSHECSMKQQIAYLARLASDATTARAAVVGFIKTHYVPAKAHVTIVAHDRVAGYITDALSLSFTHAVEPLVSHRATRVAHFVFGKTHRRRAADGSLSTVEFRVLLPSSAPRNALSCVTGILQGAALKSLRKSLGSIYHVDAYAAHFACTARDRASGAYRAWVCFSFQCARDHVAGAIELIRAVVASGVTDAGVAEWKSTSRVRVHTKPVSILDTMLTCAAADIHQLPELVLSAAEMAESVALVSPSAARALSTSLAANMHRGLVSTYVA
jgi:hypothetical protein